MRSSSGNLSENLSEFSHSRFEQENTTAFSSRNKLTTLPPFIYVCHQALWGRGTRLRDAQAVPHLASVCVCCLPCLCVDTEDQSRTVWLLPAGLGDVRRLVDEPCVVVSYLCCPGESTEDQSKNYVLLRNTDPVQWGSPHTAEYHVLEASPGTEVYQRTKTYAWGVFSHRGVRRDWPCRRTRSRTVSVRESI